MKMYRLHHLPPQHTHLIINDSSLISSMQPLRSRSGLATYGEKTAFCIFTISKRKRCPKFGYEESEVLYKEVRAHKKHPFYLTDSVVTLQEKPAKKYKEYA